MKNTKSNADYLSRLDQCIRAYHDENEVDDIRRLAVRFNVSYSAIQRCVKLSFFKLKTMSC